MILVAILALSGVVLLAIASALNALPSFPTSVLSFMSDFVRYLQAGMGFVYSFVNPGPVKLMFGFTVALIGIYEGYKIVMWVMKKIPMFGVSE